MCLGASVPKAEDPPPPPQAAKAPDTAPLRRRNASGSGGIATPAGSTLLSGPSGIANAQLNLGGQTLLGGG